MQSPNQKLLAADSQLDNPQGASNAFESGQPKDYSNSNRINGRGSAGSSPSQQSSQGSRVRKQKGGRQSLNNRPGRQNSTANNNEGGQAKGKKYYSVQVNKLAEAFESQFFTSIHQIDTLDHKKSSIKSDTLD